MPSPLALALLGVHAAVLAVTAANRVYWRHERRRPLDLDGPFARLSILVPARKSCHGSTGSSPVVLAVCGLKKRSSGSSSRECVPGGRSS